MPLALLNISKLLYPAAKSTNVLWTRIRIDLKAQTLRITEVTTQTKRETASHQVIPWLQMDSEYHSLWSSTLALPNFCR